MEDNCAEASSWDNNSLSSCLSELNLFAGGTVVECSGSWLAVIDKDCCLNKHYHVENLIQIVNNPYFKVLIVANTVLLVLQISLFACDVFW